MNAITVYLYSFQLIRKGIGGNWYLINDYRRNCQYWLPYIPNGYHIEQTEYWQ